MIENAKINCRENWKKKNREKKEASEIMSNAQISSNKSAKLVADFKQIILELSNLCLIYYFISKYLIE